jgi:integrase
MKHTRKRYQQGSLTTEVRKNKPNVWIYRWRERCDGRTVNRKVVLGSVKELTKTQAQRKASEYEEKANSAAQSSESSLATVAEMVKHYRERELSDASQKTVKVRKAYHSILDNYVLPKWSGYWLTEVKAIAVEDWLKSIDKANSTKAKIREVFGAVFRHAMRYEVHPTNPISNVRQVRKRATDQSILEPIEIVALLKQLEGIEPVRTAFLIAAVTGMRRVKFSVSNGQI